MWPIGLFLALGLPPYKCGDPTELIASGYHLIKNLFIQEREGEISCLPLLPREFISGRLTAFPLQNGELDMEWRSGKLRRLMIKMDYASDVKVNVPGGIKSFRVHGSRVKKGEVIHFPSKKWIQLDRFE